MRKKTWILGGFPLLLLAVACAGSQPGDTSESGAAAGALNTRIDGGVSPEVAAEIAGIERAIFDGMEASDSSALRSRLAPSVLAQIESGPGFDQLFQSLRQRLTGSSTSPFHLVHIADAPPGGDPITVALSEPQPMQLEFPPPAAEVYVSLLHFTKGLRTQMLGLIYGRIDGEWQLYTMNLGAYSVSHRNAMEWYREATGFASQGRTLPALMRLNVAWDLMRPLPFLRYDGEGQVRALRDELAGTLEASHSFPIVFDDVSGSPQVLRFEPAFLGEFPTLGVAYVTGGKLDQAAVDAEVPALAQKIEAMFEGVCHGSRKMVFTAFGELPTDAERQYETINAVADCGS